MKVDTMVESSVHKNVSTQNFINLKYRDLSLYSFTYVLVDRAEFTWQASQLCQAYDP